MRGIPFILILCLLWNCKVIEKIYPNSANKFNKEQGKVLEEIYSKKLDFETFETIADIDFENEKQKQSIKVQLKVKNNEFIYASVNVVGIPFARMLITKDSIHYYEKLNKTYLRENINYLENQLGAQFDFSQLQNTLLGEAILRKEKNDYNLDIFNALINLSYIVPEEKERTTSLNDLNQNISFHQDNLRMIKQFFSTDDLSKKLEIRYSDRKSENRFVPDRINAKFEFKTITKLDIQYKRIKFDQELKYRFKIPRNYSKVQVQ